MKVSQSNPALSESSLSAPAREVCPELLAGITAGVIGARIREASGNKILQSVKNLIVNQRDDGLVFVDIDLGRDLSAPNAKVVLEKAKSSLFPYIAKFRNRSRESDPAHEVKKDGGVIPHIVMELIDRLRERGVHVNSVSRVSLSLSHHFQKHLLLDVECSDKIFASLRTEVEGLEQKTGCTIGFFRAPRWQTRKAIREMQASGAIATPEEIFRTLTAQSCEHFPESALQDPDLDLSSGPPFCTIDSPKTQVAEDALRALVLPASNEIYVGVHFPDVRYPQRGFRPGEEILTLGGGFVLGEKGELKSVHFGRGLVRVQDSFSFPALERQIQFAEPLVQESVLSLREAAVRLAKSQDGGIVGDELASGSAIVNSLLIGAYQAFTESFSKSEAKFIFKAPKTVSPFLISKVAEVLPGIEEGDFYDSLRLGAVLLNLYDLRKTDLFQQVLTHVSSRPEYRLGTAQEILELGKWARFKANGLAGLYNQKVALHALGDGKEVSQKDLEVACALLNQEAVVVKERMTLRNASIISNRKFHAARHLLAEGPLEAAVRRWDPQLGLVVEVKDLELAGAVHPLDFEDEPATLPSDVQVVWDGIDPAQGVHRFRLAG
ncbi:MAG: hypothetical protein KDD64_06725 [Bdellovibrionales bacterium]|nr:hypothetical protein [Bdellovibrionales bacterium]